MSSPLHNSPPAVPPPLGIVGTGLLAGVAALLLFAATHGLIVWLLARTNIEPALLWFAAGGLGVFVPLVLIGIGMLYWEGALAKPDLWHGRLWVRPMTGTDWLWSLAGLAAVGVCMGAILGILKALGGEVSFQPSFMTMEPVTPDRYWILAVWLPFWLVNILGEGFLWQGVVLPRQEVAFGRWAWVANGLAWFVFHLAFGTGLLLVLWPVLFILPYAVQRRRNGWIGVVIHGGLNGPGFLAVAFGLV